ncbi:MAG: host attachment protein [Rickettsiales bacterium]|nr:host attachment protein [Rickettsiales bacterium]
MMKNSKKKLLLVADLKIAKFYLAENFKIKNLIKEINSEELEIHHDRQARKTGRFHKSSGSGPRFFDPPSTAKEIDRKDFCKVIIQEILHLVSETHYDQVILICGPKMLGDIRSTKFKDMDVMEFGKELTHCDMKTIEEEILKELKFK